MLFTQIKLFHSRSRPDTKPLEWLMTPSTAKRQVPREVLTENISEADYAPETRFATQNLIERVKGEGRMQNNQKRSNE